MGFTTVLVDAKKRKTDRFYTRLNRKIERYFINKIKKKDPASYERVLKVYDSKNQ
jgi:predicted HAD superfamily phosphohydrolase YqeG